MQGFQGLAVLLRGKYRVCLPAQEKPIYQTILLRFTCYLNFFYYCQTPDQTKIKIRSNQKSGEAL